MLPVMPARYRRTIAVVLTLTIALLGLVVSGLTVASAAQVEEPTYPVTGTVTGSDGQPLAGVTFTFTGGETEVREYVATTDAQGRYALAVVAGELLRPLREGRLRPPRASRTQLSGRARGRADRPRRHPAALRHPCPGR